MAGKRKSRQGTNQHPPADPGSAEELRLPPALRSDTPLDPNDAVMLAPPGALETIVDTPRFRSRWVSARAVRCTREEGSLQRMYDDLVDIGDVDGALAVLDRIIRLRGLMLEIVGIPKRPGNQADAGARKLISPGDEVSPLD